MFSLSLLTFTRFYWNINATKVQLITICRFSLRIFHESLNSVRDAVSTKFFSPLPFFCSIFCKLCKMHPKKYPFVCVASSWVATRSQHKNVDGDNFSKKWFCNCKFSRSLQNLSPLFQAAGISALRLCFVLHFSV